MFKFIKTQTLRGTAALGGVVLLGTLALLAGCPSHSSNSTASAPPPVARAAGFHGEVFGGRQPIIDATVVAYAAGATEGAAPTEIGTATTGPYGHFRMNFAPTPAAGQIVYVIAKGGISTTDGSRNSAIKLMTVAGAYCTGSPQDSPPCDFPASVNINELTTVASAAALKHYLQFVDCQEISDDSQPTGLCAALVGATGLARMAGTVTNLVNLATGQASAFLAAHAGTSDNGTPASEPFLWTWKKLDTLANVLAGCVNATGPTSSACTALFAAAGGGTTTDDTLKAARRIAAIAAITGRARRFYALQGETSIYLPILNTAPATTIPDFWTISGDRFAIAANEGGNDVSAWRLAIPGALVDNGTIGAIDGPISIATSPGGRYVYVASMSYSQISEYAVNTDGSLTSIGSIQSGGNMHAIAMTHDGRYIYTANLAGSISEFTVNTNGTLASNGSVTTSDYNPDSLVVGPGGRFLYVAHLLTSGIVSAYTINADGTLTALDTIGAGAGPVAIAGVMIPSGRYVYVVNSDDNDLSLYYVSNGDSAAPGVLTALGAEPTIGAGTDPLSVAATPGGRYLYVTNAGSNDISEYLINADGTLSANGTAPCSGAPSAVAVGPRGRRVYVTANDANSLCEFAINPDGTLSAIGTIATGKSPLAVAVSSTGQVYVANQYHSSVSEYTINSPPDAGTLSVIGTIPTGTEPYLMTLSPDGRHLYVPNFGAGNISEYTVNADGTLSALSSVSTPGGPFSVLVTPNQLYAYVTTFLTIFGEFGKIGEYGINADGTLHMHDKLPIFSDRGPIGEAVSPDGRRLYVTRAPSSGSIAEYSIGGFDTQGALTQIGTVGTGSNPGGVAISPDGRYAYIANYDSYNLSEYTIDADGTLAPNGTIGAGAGAFSVAVSPDGRHVYVTNVRDGTVSEYAVKAAGALSAIGAAAATTNGTSETVAVSPDGRNVYVSATHTTPPGSILEYAVNADGTLAPEGSIAAGSGAISVVVSPDGNHAYVDNIVGDTISEYRINHGAPVEAIAANSCNNVSGTNPGNCFGAGASPFAVALGPAGRYVYAANTDADSISAWVAAPDGSLKPVAGSPFATDADPRAVAVDPTGHYLYVAHDGQFGEVSAYAIAADGALTPVAGSPFSAGEYPASVAVDSSGRYVYAANSGFFFNCGNSDISAWAIGTGGALASVVGSPFATSSCAWALAADPTRPYLYAADFGDNEVSAFTIGTGGTLTEVPGSPFPAGTNPFSIAVDPAGRYVYVANITDDDVSAFAIGTGGALTPVTGSPFPAGGGPSSIRVDPAGQYVYVANQDDNSVSVYTIGAGGALTEVPGSPFPAGSAPFALATGP